MNSIALRGTAKVPLNHDLVLESGWTLYAVWKGPGTFDVAYIGPLREGLFSGRRYGPEHPSQDERNGEELRVRCGWGPGLNSLKVEKGSPGREATCGSTSHAPSGGCVRRHDPTSRVACQRGVLALAHMVLAMLDGRQCDDYVSHAFMISKVHCALRCTPTSLLLPQTGIAETGHRDLPWLKARWRQERQLHGQASWQYRDIRWPNDIAHPSATTGSARKQRPGALSDPSTIGS